MAVLNTYSEIQITFNTALNLYDVVSFNTKTTSFTITTVNNFERFVDFRKAKNEVTKEVTTPTNIISATNFKKSFEVDYNLGDEFEVTQANEVITIKAKNENVTFDLNTFVNNNSDVTFLITNFTGTLLSIDSVVFSEATVDPNSKIKVSVTTSVLAENVTTPVTITGNTNNPFTFEISRSTEIIITCDSADGQQVEAKVTTPEILDVTKLENEILENGTVVSSPKTNLAVTYSLDDITYQSSNIFPALSVGFHNIYVKDIYGTTITQQFEVKADVLLPTITKQPHFSISDNNSIRFVNRIKFNNARNLKNDFNTLSCEAFARNQRLAYMQFILLQSTDKITTQFNSNFDTLTANIIKSDNSEVNLPIVKKTNYIGLTSRLDAKKYDLTNGKTGIYFTSGNTYAYDTGVVNGTYDFNGKLPPFAYSSNYIKLVNDWFLIEDIIYDNDKKAQVLVINNVFTTAEETVQISAVYDSNNYDTYEFKFDSVDFIDSNIKIRLDVQDSRFTDLEQLSEFINIKRNQESTVEVRYKSKDNTDINYSFGQENILRLKINRIDGGLNGDNENYQADNKTININSVAYKVDTFEYEPVTKQRAYQIAYAHIHDIVHIQNVKYVASDIPEIDGAKDDSNLYVVKATMIIAENLNAQQMAQIPSMIEGNNDGFIKWIEY